MGWRKKLTPMPLIGSKSAESSAARVLALSVVEINHAEASVKEAPKPSIVWYVWVAVRSMVVGKYPPSGANVTGGCCCRSLLWSAVVIQIETRLAPPRRPDGMRPTANTPLHKATVRAIDMTARVGPIIA